MNFVKMNLLRSFNSYYKEIITQINLEDMILNYLCIYILKSYKDNKLEMILS